MLMIMVKSELYLNQSECFTGSGLASGGRSRRDTSTAKAQKTVSLSLETTPVSPWSDEAAGQLDGDTIPEEVGDGDDEDLPYPGFVPVAFRYLTQNTFPRNVCLRLVTHPYPFLDVSKLKQLCELF